MTLRPATLADIPKTEQCARQFYSSSEFIRNFDMDYFSQSWTTLLTRGLGVILLLLGDQGEVAGMLGGVRVPDPNSGDMVASECFWFVSPDARGEGWKLYRAFERWAKEGKCREIQMVHLTDSMPERLEKFYHAAGFRRAEVRYVKELCR